MRARDVVAAVAASLAVILLLAGSDCGMARAETFPALAGQVFSAEEGPMEGVLVSAKKDGATVTITVVSDGQGHYGFPATKLEPGHYTLTIRAVGYDLDGPGAVDVATGQAVTADIKLRRTKNLSAQLSDAEWLVSMPGTDDQKKFLLDCNGCHSLQRIVKSTHDADEFVQVFNRMAGYYPGSIPIHPQRLVGTARRPMAQGPRVQAAANYLASINLSERTAWDYSLKTLPRPTGRATRVAITEYDMSRRTVEPHDVILDSDGMVWYSDFGEQFLGKMDPKTGKVTEYPIPEIKTGFPTGALSLETDPDGNLWVGLMYQGGIAKFDRKTETIQLFPVPSEWQTDATQLGQVSPAHSNVDQKIWVKNSAGEAILRFDLATGKYEDVGVMTDAKGLTVNPYGMSVDNENNAYFLDFRTRNVGKYETKTGKVTIYPTPTPNSRPRKGRVDTQDRVWFAEYAGNAIAMFDPKTEKITEWPLPTPWSAPYDVVLDKNGEAWTGSMWTDLGARLDTKTGRMTEYPLPRETNIRRVFVDNSTIPVTFWTGSNHGASIVKVEPLD